jgi:hypothetical protein
MVILPESVQDHGEEDKFAEQWDHERGGWDNFCQEQEEHGEGEQDGDGQRHLHQGDQTRINRLQWWKYWTSLSF